MTATPIRHWLWAGLAPVAAAFAIFPASPALAGCTLHSLVELPVMMRGLSPIVKLSVDGQEIPFLLDSGAFYSTIGNDSAQQLNLPVHSPSGGRGYISGIAGGRSEARIATAGEIRLGPMSIKKVEFFLLTGWQGPGMLGQNVLHATDVDYDLGRSIVRLYLPSGCEGQGLAYWATDGKWSSVDHLSKWLAHNQTMFRVEVNGHAFNALLDTGSPISLLSDSAARRVGLREDTPGVRPGGPVSGVGGGTVRSWIAPVTSFRIGDEEIQRTHLRIAALPDPGFDMVIGMDFLLSHHVYVANSQGKVYFTYTTGPVFNLTTLSESTAGRAPTELAPGTEDSPADAGGFARRASVRLARKERNEALADLDHALELAPDDIDVLTQRARLLQDMHEYARARTDADRLVGLKPDDFAGQMLRVRILVLGGDLPAARAGVDTASLLVKDAPDHMESLAAAYGDVGDMPAALHLLDAALATHHETPMRSQLLNQRCWLRVLHDTELDAALRDCNAADFASASTPNILDSRGLLWIRRGEWARAIKDYDQALRINPQLAWSLLGRSIARRHLGQVEAAHVDYHAAIAMAPGLPDEARRYGFDVPPDP